jgi:small subunit ribosomal protein S16
VAVKIKLKRMGKIREPYYRIVVADARTKRDGRAIEEIGKYHPKADPSFIEVNSERAQHWLSVGAQPTDPVRKLLEVTGDWQRFKGLPGAEGTLKAAAPRGDKKDAFAAALAETHAEAPAAPKGRGRAGGKAGDAKAADAKARDAKAADDTGQPKAGGAKRGAKADEDKGEKPEKRTRSARSGGAKGDSAKNDSAKSDAAKGDAGKGDAAKPSDSVKSKPATSGDDDAAEAAAAESGSGD